MPDFDLDRDLPTTAADVEALHRLSQSRPMATDDYLRFLASFAPPTAEALRQKPGPCGEPFTLYPTNDE
jgi:hypothetical protein